MKTKIISLILMILLIGNALFFINSDSPVKAKITAILDSPHLELGAVFYFDAHNVGQQPEEWTISGENYDNVVSINHSWDSRIVLKMQRDLITGNHLEAKRWPYMNDTLEVSFDLAVNNTATNPYVGFANDTAYMCWVGIYDDAGTDKLCFSDGVTTTYFEEPSINTWYNFRLLFNFASGDLTLWIDGELKHEESYLVDTSAYDFQHIRFLIRDTDKGIAYFDNIAFRQAQTFEYDSYSLWNMSMKVLNWAHDYKYNPSATGLYHPNSIFNYLNNANQTGSGAVDQTKWTYARWGIMYPLIMAMEAYQVTGEWKWISLVRDGVGWLIDECQHPDGYYEFYYTQDWGRVQDDFAIAEFLLRYYKLSGDSEARDSAIKAMMHNINYGWNESIGMFNDCPFTNYSRINMNCHASSGSAYAYHILGDDIYREKAVSIMNNLSNVYIQWSDYHANCGGHPYFYDDEYIQPFDYQTWTTYGYAKTLYYLSLEGVYNNSWNISYWNQINYLLQKNVKDGAWPHIWVLYAQELRYYDMIKANNSIPFVNEFYQEKISYMVYKATYLQNPNGSLVRCQLNNNSLIQLHSLTFLGVADTFFYWEGDANVTFPERYYTPSLFYDIKGIFGTIGFFGMIIVPPIMVWNIKREWSLEGRVFSFTNGILFMTLMFGFFMIAIS